MAIASGSTFFYFAQPVLGSLVVGCVFLVSIAVGRPMVQALALEFWPLTPDMLAHPAVGRLLRRLTFLWAGINLAIGASTLTLLVLLPLPLFVAVKQVVAWSITAAGIAVTIDRSVRTARRAGFAAEAPRPASRSIRRKSRTPAPRRAQGLFASTSSPGAGSEPVMTSVATSASRRLWLRAWLRSVAKACSMSRP